MSPYLFASPLLHSLVADVPASRSPSASPPRRNLPHSRPCLLSPAKTETFLLPYPFLLPNRSSLPFLSLPSSPSSFPLYLVLVPGSPLFLLHALAFLLLLKKVDSRKLIPMFTLKLTAEDIDEFIVFTLLLLPLKVITTEKCLRIGCRSPTLALRFLVKHLKTL